MAITDDIDVQVNAALRLEYMIGQVTQAELNWQDANYDRDSILGRELLFLIANNEWIRTTSEIVDITRSDAIETAIDVDIDLSRIGHEALRDRIGPIWLPIAVLPPLRQRLADPDSSYSALTVIDASGSPLTPLPRADVCHRVAAALTDIFLSLAETIAGEVPDRDMSFSATRDHHLLLSAAVYRLLRGETVPAAVLSGSVPAADRAQGPMRRIDHVRHQVRSLLFAFRLFGVPDRELAPSETTTRLLAQRAIRILAAFASSAIVVVGAEREQPLTVLTVRLPGRALHSAKARWREVFGAYATSDEAWARSRSGRLPRSGGWRRLRPGNWIFPGAGLHIDLLLPSADADRQIRVNLPDGISPDPTLPAAVRADLDIRCEQPAAVRQLASAVSQLADADQDWPSGLVQSLADLAGSRADTARALLRDYRVGADPDEPPLGPTAATRRTRAFRLRLTELGTVLRELAAHGLSNVNRRDLISAWEGGAWLGLPMQRRTSIAMISPKVVAARTRMIEDIPQHAAPISARLEVNVAVTDSASFSAAGLSGWINVLLMIIALGFFSWARAFGIGAQQVSAEVTALVLALFTAIQVGRIERPDRSTLRGLLVPAGNALVVLASVPPVVLAVALGYSRSVAWVTYWAAACIIAQLSTQTLMWLSQRRALLRGLRTHDADRPESGLIFYTDPPDYTHIGVLNSDWWRRTTAEAVTLGAPAYGYVVWQRKRQASFSSLLDGARLAADPSSLSVHPSEPANVLALQRSSTGTQSLTFAVFRDQPADWPEDAGEVTEVALDPGRLTWFDDAAGQIGVFLGFRPDSQPRVREHPITAVLSLAALRGLIVSEIRLPCPPPLAAYADLQWACVQLSASSQDLRHSMRFLVDLQLVVTTAVVGVQASSDGFLRILNPRPPAAQAAEIDSGSRRSRLVLASDLDAVTRGGRLLTENASAPSWRLMAVCEDWHLGVEGLLLARLDPELALVGLTSAIHHGKAVLMLLLHQSSDGRSPNEHHDSERLGSACLDVWQSSKELGAAVPCPLLHVRMRAPDRAGATSEMLESLRRSIDELSPVVLGGGDLNVRYARTVIANGDVTEIELSIVLPGDQHDGYRIVNPAEWWGPSDFARIERRALALIGQKMAGSLRLTSFRDATPETPADTMIRARLVTMPDTDRYPLGELESELAESQPRL
jgi:hypothetical protein